MSHRCAMPRWFRGRYRNSPYVCACGKAWLSRQVYVLLATGGGLDVTAWTWRRWKP